MLPWSPGNMQQVFRVRRCPVRHRALHQQVPRRRQAAVLRRQAEGRIAKHPSHDGNRRLTGIGITPALYKMRGYAHTGECPRIQRLGGFLRNGGGKFKYLFHNGRWCVVYGLCEADCDTPLRRPLPLAKAIEIWLM